MPRISALPVATSAQITDELPIVQGAVTKRLTFATAQSSGLFLPADNTISTNKLVDDAVTADKLQADNSNNANRAVTSNHIQDSAVITDKINNLGVTTPKLADGAVTTVKLAANSLTISKFTTTDQIYLQNAGTARPGTAVITNGSVENIVVYEQGSGYLSTPNVVISPSPTGNTATAVATLTGGAVTSIAVTNSGSGYTTDPTVTIDASPGTTAKAFAYAITSGLAAQDDGNSGTGSEQAGFFITADKKVKVVGYNSYTKNATGLGNHPNPLPSECAVGTSSGSYVKPYKIYGAYSNTYMIDTLGRVYSCGYGGNNGNGQAGTSNLAMLYQIPSTFFANKPVVQLAFTGESTSTTVIARTADGKAYGWGYQNYVPLGNGSAANVATPIAVASGNTLTDVKVICGQTYASSLLIEAGTGQVLCSGYNGYGRLSQGDTTARTTFGYYLKSAGTPLGAGAEGKVIKALGSGDNSYGYTVLLTDQGKVFTAGYNDYGQRGTGTTGATGAGYADEVMSSGAVDIYVPVGNGSYGCTMIRKSDGSVWAAGYSGQGNFGNGGTANTNSTFVQVWNPATQGTTAVKLVLAGSANYFTSYLLGANGVLYVCGSNNYGQLGDGTTTQRNSWTPTNLNPGNATIVDFRVDSYTNVINPRVLMSDGKVYTCGYNGNWSLGNGYTYQYYATWNNILF
jgi:alpha-tubulin suppressor-like RCC1 family protein